MTYLAFHLVFILPPILLLAVPVRRGPALGPRARWSLPAMMAIALVYTTPWDNYLVWRGVWGYAPGRVLGTIGYVPVEEYLFFLLQPLLSGLWVYLLLGRAAGAGRAGSPGGIGELPGPPPASPGAGTARTPRPAAADPAASAAAAPAGAGSSGAATVRWAGALAYALATAAGALLLRREEGTYLGLILVWAAPVLALQWAYAGGEIWPRRRTLALGVAAPTLYLWVADAAAIRLGIWTISERHTLGPELAGVLPLEEAVFFLVTNLLVVQGLLLFLYPPGHGEPSPSAAAEPA